MSKHPFPTAPKPASPQHAPLLLAALMMAEVTAGFETGLIYGAMKPIYQHFEGSSLVGWMLSGYLLVAATCTPIFARLGDLYGRARLLYFVLLISVIGSLLSWWSEDTMGIVLGRALQGASGAVLPLCYGICREAFERKMAMTLVGVLSGTITVAAGFGILLGGLIADHFDWQILFIVAAGVGTLSILMVRLWVPRRAASGHERIDLMGGVLFVTSLALLLFGIDGIGNRSVRNGEILALLVTGLSVLFIWARYEARHPFPLIDVRALANRRITLAIVGMFLIALGPMQINIAAPLLMQQPVASGAGLGLSGTITGSLIMATMMTPLAGGPWAGYLAARRSGCLPLRIGIMLVAVSCLLMAFHFNTLWWLVVLLFLKAFGVALILAGIPMVLIEAAPGGRVSEIVSMASVLRQFALALGAQSVMLVLANNAGTANLVTGSRFHLLFAMMAFTAVLACLMTTFIPRPRPAATESSR